MSKETDHLHAYVLGKGIYARITPKGYWRPLAWPSRHAQRGYVGNDGTNHSLALDLAGLTPSRDSQMLLLIFETLLEQRHKLRELYYSGPGATHNVYRGVVTPMRDMPRSIRDGHHDHVHVSVDKGVFLPSPSQPVPLPPLPPPTHYPKDAMTAYPIRIKTDDQGAGAQDLRNVAVEKVVSVVLNGRDIAPRLDEVGAWDRFQVPGAVRFRLKHAPADALIDATVWVAD